MASEKGGAQTLKDLSGFGVCFADEDITLPFWRSCFRRVVGYSRLGTKNPRNELQSSKILELNWNVGP